MCTKWSHFRQKKTRKHLDKIFTNLCKLPSFCHVRCSAWRGNHDNYCFPKTMKTHDYWRKKWTKHMINNSKKYVKKSHNKTVQKHAKKSQNIHIFADLGTKHCIDSKLFPKSAPKVNAKSTNHNWVIFHQKSRQIS